MNVYVYIDGFNFYYGAVKGTAFKWLDFRKLAQDLLPFDNIVKIKCFTALVSPTASNPDAPQRQQIYLRALRAWIPNIEISLGCFLDKEKTRPIVGTGQLVRVKDREEKGSDVNLGVHLVNDGWKKLYDAALVISNDSDLVEAIRIVRDELRKPVGVANPQMKKSQRMAVQLHRIASFKKRISVSNLRAAQLPSPIPGTSITKPVGW